jgi:hypothetical protein
LVNNSTDINKTNNHLSPKESLNSGGQQFHQYQQNKLSPKESLNSDGQQFHRYLRFVDIGGIVDHHCLNFL